MNQCTNAQPEAFITTNKNRRKLEGNNIYLENNTTFEIELFNPTSQVLKAMIKINGNYISLRGLVLNPGQRVFLERHIDTPEKFLFSTYVVNKGNDAVAKAIQDNGSVEIEFYPEKLTPVPYTITINGDHGYMWTNSCQDQNTFYSSTNNVPSSSMFRTSGTSTRSFAPDEESLKDDSDTLGFMDQNLSRLRSAPLKKSTVKKESLSETGRVEKGEVSNQSFSSVNKEFEIWYTRIVKFKILPLSEKKIQVNELVKYCTSCGKKSKKEHRFCSSCGTQL
jgi:hypothetical protein